MRTRIGDEAAKAAGEALYICRAWNPDQHNGKRGITRTTCHRCHGPVAVTAGHLSEQRARARELVVDLTILCDTCGQEKVAENAKRPIVVELPLGWPAE